jgi:uncharacterized protein (TIGR03437 family)
MKRKNLILRVLLVIVFALAVLARLSTNNVSAQSGGTCATPSFGPRKEFQAEVGLPRRVVTADLNLDGKLDLVVTNDGVSVLLGDGNGNFGAATRFTVGNGSRGLAVSDFNSDGKPDLAIANWDTRDISILFGNGSGGFSAPTNFPTGNTEPGNTAITLVAGDFNGDTKPDIAVTSWFGKVAILLGNGAGGFGTPTNFDTGGSTPGSIATGDFNQDGKVDLVISNDLGGSIATLLGNGSGGFGAPNPVILSRPGSVTVADFNADSRPDIAVTAGGSLSVLLGDGNGGLGAPASITSAGSPSFVTTGDFNTDGKADLAFTHSSNSAMSVLLGNGTGGFGTPTTYPVSFTPASLASGDFNADNKLDLVVANGTLGLPKIVSIFLNTCGVPKIEVTPTSLGFGTVTSGQTKDLSLTIRNTGSSSLTVNSLTNSNPNFRVTAPDAPFNVAAGGQQTVTVRFEPTTIGNLSGTLSIASTDPASPTTVALTGVGGDPCAATITPTSQSFATAGGSGSVTVTIASGCNWTATSNASWISITSGASGSGNGTVNYSVATNPTSAARSGTLTIAGLRFAVQQGTAASNWVAQTSGTTNELRSVHFISAMEGWAAGANATLLKTTNGGTSWSAVNTGVDPARGFNTVRFRNRNTGFVGGDKSLARTLDAGANWTLATASIVNGSDLIASLSPISDTDVWLAGGNESNRASSFFAHYRFSPTGSLTFIQGSFGVGTDPTQDIGKRDLQFFDIGVGWAVGAAGRITKWTGAFPQPSQSQTSGTRQALNGIQMFPGTLGFLDSRGWIVGDNGTILKTINGGDTWTLQASGTTVNLRDVYFLDEQRGWAVGDGGVILATTDGGSTWVQEASGVTTDLRSVHFVSASVGFVVGANGTILRRVETSTATSVSAASYVAGLAADAIASAFGTNLATGTEGATSLPLPTTLAGTTVKVKDSAGDTRDAPLFYVSPMQVNYLIPPGTKNGTATVIVTNGNGNSAAGTIEVMTVAPGLFTANQDGMGAPAGDAVHEKPSGLSKESLSMPDPVTGKHVPRPIDLGPEGEVVVLELYGTGIRGRSAQSAVSATIGGVPAVVEYADKQAEYAGLDQVNLKVPRALIGRGEVDVVLTVDGKVANIVKINIR